MTMVDNDVIEAFRIAEQEMQDEWERRQADVAKGLPYRSGPQVLAAHWLIVFAPSRCGLVQAGVPIGNVLDIVKEEGREFPPAVEAVWKEWHDKIKAAEWERLSPWQRRQLRRRKPEAPPLTR